MHSGRDGEEEMKLNNQKITIPVFVPLSLAVLILLGSSILGGYLLQRDNLLKNVKLHVRGAQQLFERYLKEDVRLMNGLIEFIGKDENLQNCWTENNRDVLLENSLPLLEDIRSKYEVTHFYYHQLDRTCFLRVHNPPKNGDLINRFTMELAAEKDKPVWGIELGRFGTFTLRVIHPWFIDGKPAGYIELGEEIEHILPVLKDTFDVELVVVIDKKFIDRSGWEEGMRMMGREGDWDFLPDTVVVDCTFENLSVESLRGIRKILSVKNQSLAEVMVGQRKYRNGFFPLIDAGGRKVGNIVVLKDVTITEAGLRMFSIALTAICIIVGAILCVLFYVYIRRIESNLNDLYTNLRGEISKRKRAEEDLHRAYGQMEIQVNERTCELQREVVERRKTEEALQKLNDELEAAIERVVATKSELEHFAFITSHHLKEPVRKISTFAGLLTRSLTDNLDDDQRENFAFMIEGADKMALMVQGLNLYLKATIDEIEFEDINLNLVLHKIKKTGLAFELEQANATILVPDRLPVVKGHGIQIGQVMQHIISNSLKFKRENVLPEITIRSNKEGPECVRVEIEDNGIGIKQEYLKDVFNPFKRLNTEKPYEGVGIGLTICKKVIERHRGIMGVKSVYGQGTILWFTLPLSPNNVDRVSDASDSATS